MSRKISISLPDAQYYQLHILSRRPPYCGKLSRLVQAAIQEAWVQRQQETARLLLLSGAIRRAR